MMRRYLWCCAVSATALCTAAFAESVPNWSPDENQLNVLSTETALSNFYLRPPKGYALTEQPVTASTKAYAWRGARRRNGKSPFLLVLITPATLPDSTEAVAEDLLKKYLTGVEHLHENWKQSATERGQIGGLSFVRAHWSGTERLTKYKWRGFIYIAIDGKNVIYISSKDTEPEHELTLPVAEASTMTLRKH